MCIQQHCHFPKQQCDPNEITELVNVRYQYGYLSNINTINQEININRMYQTIRVICNTNCLWRYLYCGDLLIWWWFSQWETRRYTWSLKCECITWALKMCTDWLELTANNPFDVPHYRPVMITWPRNKLTNPHLSNESTDRRSNWYQLPVLRGFKFRT